MQLLSTRGCPAQIISLIIRSVSVFCEDEEDEMEFEDDNE